MMMLIALYPSVSANDSGIIVDQELVTVSLANKGLQVDETIKVTNKGMRMQPRFVSGSNKTLRILLKSSSYNQAKNSFLLSREISEPVT